MPFRKLFFIRWLSVPYTPHPDQRPFLDRAQVQKSNDVEVKVAVLGSHESHHFFGANLARRGIQPVWLEVTNQTSNPLLFDRVKLDPNYYPPREAALVSHFAIGKRLAEYGLLALLFLPLLIFVPLKYFGARRANRRMDDFFCAHSFPLGPVVQGETSSGFVFTSLDDGNKSVSILLLSSESTHRFDFTVPVPGIAVDYEKRPFEDLHSEDSIIDCDEAMLRDHLANQPRATTNRLGLREGDPTNLVVIGDFAMVLAAFGARWDETETISLASCWRTAKAFLFGSRYRYSPVSPLYLYNRSQDFALQRARHTINERLHLRLWLTPLRFEGKSVWVGQISRDIGVRFTLRTWNLTTHRIDPAVDEARDYVLADLLESGRLERMGYGKGVGASEAGSPRCNLTGDPYITDGYRAVLILSSSKTSPSFLGWMEEQPSDRSET